MAFRDDYDMHGVKGARMMEGQHIVRFNNFPDRHTLAQDLVTVKIICRIHHIIKPANTGINRAESIVSIIQGSQMKALASLAPVE
jgi:hypothetical protein